MRNPLLTALKNNDFPGFQDALNNGNNPNEKDEKGVPILLLACRMPSSDYALAMIECPGVDIHASHNGKTALTIAQEDASKVLIEALFKKTLIDIHLRASGNIALEEAKTDSDRGQLIQISGTKKSDGTIQVFPKEIWYKIAEFLDNKSIAALRVVAVSLEAYTRPLFLKRLGFPKLIIDGSTAAALWAGKAYYWGDFNPPRFLKSRDVVMPEQVPMPGKEGITQIISTTKPFTFLSQQRYLYSLTGGKFGLPNKEKVTHAVSNELGNFLMLAAKNGGIYRFEILANSKEYEKFSLQGDKVKKFFTFDHYPCWNGLILTQSGKHYAMGFNPTGHLGLGDRLTSKNPRPFILPEGEQISQTFYKRVSSSVDDEQIFLVACFTEKGHLYCWGSVWDFGVNTCHHIISSPQAILLPDDKKTSEVFYCAKRLFARTECGQLYEVAAIVNRQLVLRADRIKIDEKEEVVQVSVHRDFIFCFTKAGRLYQIDASNGILPVVQVLLPEHEIVIQFFSAHDNRRVDDNATRIFQDTYISKTESGKLYAWGSNIDGELGFGHNNPVTTPTQIPVPNNKKIKQCLLAGARALFCVTENGQLFSCGFNQDGLLGLGLEDDDTRNTLQLVSLAENETVHRIFLAGNGVLFCIGKTGQLYSWGYPGVPRVNSFSVLGRPTFPHHTPKPITIFSPLIKLRKTLSQPPPKNVPSLFFSFPAQQKETDAEIQKSSGCTLF